MSCKYFLPYTNGFIKISKDNVDVGTWCRVMVYVGDTIELLNHGIYVIIKCISTLIIEDVLLAGSGILFAYTYPY